MTKKLSVSQSRLVKTLDRHPAMPTLLSKSPPQLVAQLFQRVGIYDSAELMTMVPAESLLRTLDASIWKSPRPGLPEQVDIDELVEWLETWNEVGESFLVERLTAMSEDYLVLLLSRVIVVDSTSTSFGCNDEDDDSDAHRPGRSEQIGPFTVFAIQDDHLDVLRTTLLALWENDRELSLRVLGRLSQTQEAPDSLRGWTTTSGDVEFERQSFREAHGYVTADGARSFLNFAASLTTEQILSMSDYDPETRRHLNALHGPAGSINPVNATLTDGASDDSNQSVAERTETASDENSHAVATLQALLESAELLDARESQLRLTHSSRSDEPLLTTRLRKLGEEHLDSLHARTREFAYIANVLKAGASVNGSELSDRQARDAAFATCNLGLELAIARNADDLSAAPGLIRMFWLGWHALSRIGEHVVTAFQSEFASDTSIKPWLRSELKAGLDDLNKAMKQRRFEDARDAVVFLTIAFDNTTCKAIVPLLDEIPRYSMLLDGHETTDEARWISTTADLERVGALLAALAVKESRR